MSKTIYLRQGQAQRVQIERRAVAALYPGHLLELTSANKVQKHSVAGGSIQIPMFALEDEDQGHDIDDAFAADDLVICIIPQRGDFIQAVLDDGENVAIGDKLESAGGGLLQKHVADSADSDDSFTGIVNQVVGIAMEAMDLSGSSEENSEAPFAADKRIWIMIS